MNARNTIFHAFTTKHNGIANRIITPIHVCQGFDPADTPAVPPQLHNTTALWDTGATKSVITSDTVKHLKLQPTGVADVNHAGGSSKHNTYVVNFILPNKVQVAGVLVTECPAVVGNFGAIIGMDIIAGGDFAITNHNGQTWASFRIPSVQAIDYVEEAKKITFAGVGRNDSCPCGKKQDSGKPVKFKHCCGK